MMMLGVPQTWATAMGHLQAALDARAQMRDRTVTQAERDSATARYTHSVDALVDALHRCMSNQLLGRITLWLARGGWF
ncbi:hypothetical protein [Pseudotabrizicola algicola]|uniref:Uncharacterized protein n=1 Tax=Pseudotabrizicola algicola TaxID=2709381 RepID=A0A6B3RNH5_9RHOB|nr:hypothetical protein [Pseudotabrizicola algicola]NEX47637.1 hypothetical protein [Pseudotabrizicola algicola]